MKVGIEKRRLTPVKKKYNIISSSNGEDRKYNLYSKSIIKEATKQVQTQTFRIYFIFITL